MLDDTKKKNILEAIYSYQHLKGNDMLQNLVGFSCVLKAAGIGITTSQVMEACESLKYIDISQKERFKDALQTSFVQRRDEIVVFSLAFNVFWSGEELSAYQEQPLLKEEKLYIPEGNFDDETDDDWQPGYSAEPLWREKDFEKFDSEELAEMQYWIDHIAENFKKKQSKRYKQLKSGVIDWRRTIKKSLSTGGDILQINKKKQKRKKVKLAVLCDVSGSMENYSKFLLQFVYALQKAINKIETFIFSTSVAKVNHLLKYKKPELALEELKNLDFDWAGGTDIGNSLKEFNMRFSPEIFTQKTIVIILSDGWDKGDLEELSLQMKNLHTKAWKTIWLNPLAGSPEYEPTCRGMVAALPHIDLFLPFNNFNALKNLCDLLSDNIKQ